MQISVLSKLGVCKIEKASLFQLLTAASVFFFVFEKIISKTRIFSTMPVVLDTFPLEKLEPARPAGGLTGFVKCGAT